ncbi:MAG: RidA family protein [Coriobacteriia bacterium]|nr:RidA family protein [Coriobacteriia bacterium]
MGAVAERLREAGMELPAAPAAVGLYVPATRVGDMVFTSGQLPFAEGSLMASGTVGADVSLEEAAECARRCALNALAAASIVCELDQVIGVAKLVGYVASAGDFTRQPAVIDGASEVMRVAFGAGGQHAREAVGVVALPLGAPVEVSIVFALQG